jgi:hypothetical protein
MTTEITDSSEFFPALRGLSAWAAAAAAVPVAASFMSMSPAWPAGIVAATSMAELAAVWFVYRLLRAATRRRATIVLLLSALVIAQSSVAYLPLNSRYTFEIPATKERSTKGFVCTPVAKLVYEDKCPDLGNHALEAADYSPATLWTIESIITVRVTLAVLWSMGFAALGAFAGACAALQARERGERSGPRLYAGSAV